MTRRSGLKVRSAAAQAELAEALRPPPEFNSNALPAWMGESGVPSYFVVPGRPMRDGICEAFTSRKKGGLLNEALFFRLDHARPAA